MVLTASIVLSLRLPAPEDPAPLEAPGPDVRGGRGGAVDAVVAGADRPDGARDDGSVRPG